MLNSFNKIITYYYWSTTSYFYVLMVNNLNVLIILIVTKIHYIQILGQVSICQKYKFYNFIPIEILKNNPFYKFSFLNKNKTFL